MKNNLLVTALLSLSLSTAAFAFCSEDEKFEMSTQGKTPFEIDTECSGIRQEANTVGSGYSFVRVGTLSTDASFEYDVTEDIYTNGGYYNDDISVTEDLSASGYEITLGLGTNFEDGYDFRPLLTFRSSTFDYDGDSSIEMLSFETEFAYRFSKYFAPFIGLGLGAGTVSLTPSTDAEDDSAAAIEFSWSIGVSGEIIGGLGYYVKIRNAVMSLDAYSSEYTEYSDAYVYREIEDITVYTTDTIFGLSYRF